MIPAEYINADGFVTVEPNANNVPGEGNGWLVTGLAYAIGAMAFASMPRVSFSDCQPAGYPYCPCITRSPHKKNPGDETKCDDYWGTFVIALLCNAAWANWALAWGEEMDWQYNSIYPDDPNPEYRFDRFPGFVPCLRIAAGKKLSLWDSIVLAGSIIWDAYHIEDASGNMRAYCKVTVAEADSFAKIAAAWWRRRVLSRYKTYGASWAAYFPVGHPLSLV